MDIDDFKIEQQLLEKLRKFHDEMSYDDSHLDHANRTTEMMLDFFKGINYFENQEKAEKWDKHTKIFTKNIRDDLEQEIKQLKKEVTYLKELNNGLNYQRRVDND